MCGSITLQEELMYFNLKPKEILLEHKIYTPIRVNISETFPITINQPTRCNNFSSLLLDVYVQLNIFRASSRPSSGAQQLQSQPLVLPMERGGSSAVGRGRAGQPA
jgi:hypothetical protein